MQVDLIVNKRTLTVRYLLKNFGYNNTRKHFIGGHIYLELILDGLVLIETRDILFYVFSLINQILSGFDFSSSTM